MKELSYIRRLRSSNSYDYLIPGNFIKQYHKTSKLELIPGVDCYVNQCELKNLLEVDCNMTIQEYYDRLILEIDSIEARPKCLNCGKPLIFSGKISHGYGHHANCDQSYLFCSDSCGVKYKYKNPEVVPSWSSKCGFSNTVSLTHRNQFLNKGSLTDICYFYLAKRSDGSLKFGITSDMESRVTLSKIPEYDREIPYVKYLIIGEGTRLDIANIEFEIKCLLGLNKEIIESYELLIKIYHYVVSHLTSN